MRYYDRIEGVTKSNSKKHETKGNVSSVHFRIRISSQKYIFLPARTTFSTGPHVFQTAHL
jgi:hypothetical protein